MNQAATEYIRAVCEGTYVGIVTFGTQADTVKELTLVGSEGARQELINSLPPVADGSTCIGCGIRQGVQVCQHNTSYIFTIN